MIFSYMLPKMEQGDVIFQLLENYKQLHSYVLCYKSSLSEPWIILLFVRRGRDESHATCEIWTV